MRKVIDGKVYDTETAFWICDVSGRHDSDRGDFRWNDTGLYRAPKGAYFIAGEGNAMSRWARHYGQSERGPGSGLEVVSEDEARELVEEHASADIYEVVFGEAESA